MPTCCCQVRLHALACLQHVGQLGVAVLGDHLRRQASRQVKACVCFGSMGGLKDRAACMHPPPANHPTRNSSIPATPAPPSFPRRARAHNRGARLEGPKHLGRGRLKVLWLEQLAERHMRWVCVCACEGRRRHRDGSEGGGTVTGERVASAGVRGWGSRHSAPRLAGLEQGRQAGGQSGGQAGRRAGKQAGGQASKRT